MKVCVTNLKGGVGKTTSAVYLAAVASSQGQQVIVVDADPQASAAEWLEQAPIDGVTVVDAPSERLIVRAAMLGDGCVVIIDTPPGSEQLGKAALGVADVAVVPTRAGGVEVTRVQATLSVIPVGVPRGLVITAARRQTRDYVDTVEGWRDAGVEVWGSVPERVAIAAGPDGPLQAEGLIVYGDVWKALQAATKEVV